MLPVRLRPDNFTPATRTPWGGTRIRSKYKPSTLIMRDTRTQAAMDAIIGESWEVSVEPTFPSRTLDDRLLSDVIAADPLGWLGNEAVARFGPQSALLVKLLDAAENLSVQVHPAAGDLALEASESGKPEGWVVLDADPGAGLYLGFRDGVARADVERCLEISGPLEQLMMFVPVRPGDAFVIDAGTPHAIGRGVTLLEPQLVWPGKAGVTYRYWDWNRKYDRDGRLSPSGVARPLHVARSLAVTRWDLGGGEPFVEACRARIDVLAQGDLERAKVIDWPWFRVERYRGSGVCAVEAVGSLRAFVCLEGKLVVETTFGELTLERGESGVIPAAAGALTARGDRALAFEARVV
jgi:mannose-6-phosphate isomerase